MFLRPNRLRSAIRYPQNVNSPEQTKPNPRSTTRNASTLLGGALGTLSSISFKTPDHLRTSRVDVPLLCASFLFQIDEFQISFFNTHAPSRHHSASICPFKRIEQAKSFDTVHWNAPVCGHGRSQPVLRGPCYDSSPEVGMLWEPRPAQPLRMVPGGGIDPPRAEARRILRPLRLPVPPSRLRVGRTLIE